MLLVEQELEVELELEDLQVGLVRVEQLALVEQASLLLVFMVSEA